MIFGLVNRYLDKLKPQAEKRTRSGFSNESGNVFFTLFGAVALVGVVGVATSTLMRGPVGTVVQLNQRAKADAQMQIAQKLAMLEAAQQAQSGDCDSDGYVEPIGALPVSALNCDGPVPSGGGCIPDAIGASKTDPWGTNYGYCSWDHGGVIGSGCAANAAGVLDGTNDDVEIVIAIISAGPDRTFNTTCGNHSAYVTKTPGSDDIVLDITYSGAVEASGGMWYLQSGDPDTAGIDKNIYVSGRGDFEGGGRFGAGLDINAGMLDMRAGALIMLPDEGSSGSCTSGTNDGALRRDTSTGSEILEICDPVTGWTNVANAGGVGAKGPLGAIQFSDGGSPAADLDYTSALSYTGGVLNTDGFNATGNANVDGNLDVGGNTNLTGTLDVDGTVTGGASGVVIGDDLTVNNDLGVTGAASITGNTDITGTLDVTNTTTLGTLNAGGTTVTTLTATGASNLNGPVFNSAGNLNLNDAVDIGGDTDITGNLIVSGDADISGDVFGAAFRNMYDGQDEGLFFDSADGLYLGINGSPALSVDSSGDVGINISGIPTAQLDIDGELRLRSSGAYTAGGACSAPGMISYNGADELLICSSITGVWETVGTSGGGGGSAGGVWDDEGDYIKYENGTYITNAGTSLTFSSALQGAGTRMLWYTSQSAFRAGGVTGSQWNETNVGEYSAAFGLDTISDGEASFAAGNASQATGDAAIALGSEVEARAPSSVALGNEAVVAAGAVNSMAIGLGLPSTASNPHVLSSNSLGIFMGDQQGVNFNTANAMLLAGGKLIIDPDTTSATNIAPSNLLTVDVEGQIGATQYCDEDGLYCFLAADVAGGATPAPGADAEVLFNSGGILGADPSFVFFRSTGNLGLGVGTPEAQIHLSEQLLLGNINDCTAATQGALRLNVAGDVLEMCDFAGSGGYISIGGGAVTAPGSDSQIVFNSNGVLDANANFVYTSAGNVGIGTPAPSTNLDIVGNAGGGNFLLRIENQTDNGEFLQTVNDIGNTAFAVGQDGAGGGAVGVYDEMGDERISLEGRIGRARFGEGSGTYNVVINGGTGVLEVKKRGEILLSDDGNFTDTADYYKFAAENDQLEFQFYDDSASTYTDIMRFNSTGYVGVGAGAVNPVTRLDVDGTLKIAYGGESCDAAREGAIHFSSDNNFYVCQSAGNWQRIITAGGGGGGLPAAGSDRQIQFNSGSELSANANFVYTSEGDFIIGSYQIEDTGTGLEDLRMFFDVSTGSFRAGTVSGAEWDYSSSGNYSAAFGTMNEASGDASFAVGDSNRAAGYASFAAGQGTVASMQNSTALGFNTQSHSWGGLAAGENTIVNGWAGFAAGGNTEANGDHSVALGLETLATGNRSFSFGLGDKTGMVNPSVVSGTESFGIFMGAQDNVNLSSANTMGLFGGSMVIDPKVPATNLSADTALEVDGTIKMAYGNEACDAAREGAIQFTSADNAFYVCQAAGSWQRIITAGGSGGGLPAAGADRQIRFNSGNELAADANFVFTSAGNMGIGTANPTSKLYIFENFAADGYKTAMSVEMDTSGSAAAYRGVVGLQTTAMNDATGAGFKEAYGLYTVGRAGNDASAQTAVGVASRVDVHAGDTGMIYSATDDGSSTGGTQYAMYINLDDADVNSYGIYQQSNNTNALFGTLGIGTQTPSSQLHLYRSAGSASALIEGDESNTSDVTLLTSGDGASTVGDATATGWSLSARGNAFATATVQNDLMYYYWDGATYQQRFLLENDTGNLVLSNTDVTGDTKLEIDGTIKIAYGGEACDAAREGAIRFVSSSNSFEFCADTGNDWEAVALGLGGASAPNRGIQFNSGGSFSADANFVYTSSGYLGLGVASPASRLHVDVPAPGLGTDIANLNVNTAGIRITEGPNEMLLDSNTLITQGSNMLFGVSGAYDIIFYTSATSQMRLTDQGRLGIGTSTPDDLLDIEGVSPDLRLTFADGTGDATLTFASADNTILGFMGYNIDNNGIRIESDADGDGVGDIQFRVDDYMAMLIDENYNVGIGTFTPDTNLDVDGTLKIGYYGEACDAAREGAIRFDSAANTFSFCADQGNDWQSVALGSGGVAAPDRGLQFNSGGNFAASANLVYTSAGKLGVGQASPESRLDIRYSGFTDERAFRVQGYPTLFDAAAATNGYKNVDLFTNGTINGINVAGDIAGVSNTLSLTAVGGSAVGQDVYGIKSVIGLGSALGGTINNAYGLYVENYADIASDSYVIYSSGGKNYFDGAVGVGSANPDTKLDVDGTIKIAYGGEACDAAREGAIRFDSAANTFSFCADQGNDWEIVSLGSGVNAINDLTDAGTQYSSASMYVGQGTPYATVSGSENLVMGYNAGSGMTNSSRNTVLGSGAGSGMTDGNDNVLLGYEAGNNIGSGYRTVAIGNYAGQGGGLHNVYVGERAGRDGTGTGNTMIGRSAGADVVTGNDNVLLGVQSESPVFGGGSSNILIGAYADTPISYISSYINIGNVFYGSMGTGELYIGGSGALKLPSGDNTTRPGTLADTTAVNGMIRYNSASGRFEGYQADSWQDILTGAAIGTLNDLTDVDTTGLADQDVLTYDSASGTWVPAAVSTDFIGLTDTPASYSGQAGRFARVNSGETAVEFTDQIIETVSGEPAPNTFDLNDLGDVNAAPAGGQALVYDSASGVWVAGTVDSGSISAAGTDRQIQFNSAGSFGADANFVYNTLGAFGIGTASPDASAIMDLTSSDRGFLPPRMDTTARNAISSPAEGLIVYNSTSNTVDYYDGSAWTSFASTAGSVSTAGSEGDLQFNSSGELGAVSGLNFNVASGTLSVDSIVNIGGTTGAAAPVGAVAVGSGGSGSSSFVGLTDSPATYSGAGSQVVAVNSGATGLEFVDADTLGVWSENVSGYIEYNSALGSMKVASITGAAAPSGAVAVSNATSLVALTDTNISSAISGQILSYDGSNWINVDGGSAGLWSSGSGDSIFYNSGSPRVGIGNATPAVELDVTGNINLTGMLMMGQIAGDAPTYISSGGGSIVAALNDLTDVDTTGVTDGQVLMYSAGAGAWVTGAGGGGSTDFLALTDTFSTYTGAAGQIVRVNSGETGLEFSNVLVTSVTGEPAPDSLVLSSLGDVDTTGVADGNVLMYSAGSGSWTVGVGGGGGGGAINDLSDASTDYATDFNMFLGDGAGASIATGGQNNLGIGQGALSGLATGDQHIAIGRNTLTQLSNNPYGTIALGYNAGRLYAPTEFSVPSIFIGDSAGEEASWWTNSAIVAIGSNVLSAGSDNNGVGGSTIVGAAAMENAGEDGQSEGNTVMGSFGGLYFRSGGDNVFIGTGVAQGGNSYYHGGDNNVIIGGDAAKNVDGNYSSNVIIGQATAASFDAGNYNILIGAGVDTPGATANNYMSIGDVIYGSGMFNTGAHIGINNSAPDVALDVTGDIEYTGTLTDVSDMRLKKDITPLNADEIIGRLSQVDTYSFRMIGDEKGQLELGVMAQEVEKVFPELVRTANDEMGTKSVNYVGFIAPLIEASKELKSENDALRAEITEMKLAQAEFKDDIMREVNGLKAHTGYGINKAQIGLWTIAILFGFSSIFFMIGGILRHRQHKQG